MSTKEKTYTFRAPPDLPQRARDAFRTWQELLESRGALPEGAWNAFSLAVARRARAFDEFDNQSALIRAMFDVFVEATEKVAEDLEYTDAYASWAREDAEARAIRRGALAAGADRWRDE
jgi:hypothetical protein